MKSIKNMKTNMHKTVRQKLKSKYTWKRTLTLCLCVFIYQSVSSKLYKEYHEQQINSETSVNKIGVKKPV